MRREEKREEKIRWRKQNNGTETKGNKIKLRARGGTFITEWKETRSERKGQRRGREVNRRGKKRRQGWRREWKTDFSSFILQSVHSSVFGMGSCLFVKICFHSGWCLCLPGSRWVGGCPELWTVWGIARPDSRTAGYPGCCRGPSPASPGPDRTPSPACPPPLLHKHRTQETAVNRQANESL